jgi:hypothetical protein
MTQPLNRAMIQELSPGSESHQTRALRGAVNGLEICAATGIAPHHLRKAKKKESKILQNEATKPNGINKSA